MIGQARYKTSNLNIITNTKTTSDSVNTIGASQVFFEIPNLTPSCITASTVVYANIYDADRAFSSSLFNGIRVPLSFESNTTSALSINTQGDCYFRLPSSCVGIKSLRIVTANTMTSTCTIKVHISY